MELNFPHILERPLAHSSGIEVSKSSKERGEEQDEETEQFCRIRGQNHPARTHRAFGE